MLSAIVLSITGYGMLRFSDEVNAKYAAVYLSAIGVFAASSGFLSWGINSKNLNSCFRDISNSDNSNTRCSDTGSPAVAAVAGGYMVMIGSVGGVLST